MVEPQLQESVGVLIACAPKAELIVALIGVSLVLGWLLCALFTWWWESRERRQW